MNVRQVSSARKGIRPILVAVNKPTEWCERIQTLKGSLLTSFHLLANLHPEALVVLVVKIDELRKEEDDPGPPEDWCVSAKYNLNNPKIYSPIMSP